MDQMNQILTAVQQSMTEVTQEVVNLRATVTANGTAMAALQATANAAWDAQKTRMDDIEKDLEEAQSQIRRGGGVREERTENWNLEHKGTVKEYGGDQKSYRQWAKRLSAFCNSKIDGFRVALVWAERIQTPITDVDLRNTGWDHIHKANTRLYDLLILVTSGDALRKVETTPGEAQWVEAWRRLARQYMPTSRLTRIDRLNALTHVEPCSSMKEVLGKIQT